MSTCTTLNPLHGVQPTSQRSFPLYMVLDDGYEEGYVSDSVVDQHANEGEYIAICTVRSRLVRRDQVTKKSTL